MVEKIGIIGLGLMGRPIAENFIRHGFTLTIFARKEQVKAEMRALGAKVVQSPKSLAEQSDMIFLIVTDLNAVRELLFGQDGIVEGAGEGTIIVDMTTSDPRFSEKLAKRLLKKKIEYLDAPISGGVLAARNAGLLIMVGGQEKIYKKCIPVFETISKKTVYMGKAGNAHLVKLINNQLAHATFLANCEALTLGEMLGLSLDSMTEVFNHGTARSYSTEIRFPRYILPKSFNMGATFATVYKDLSLVRKLKNRAGLKLPITHNAYSYYKFAVNSGDEGEDFSKIFLKMKELTIK